MDVFISWSGERSKAVAEALRWWLPKLINATKPWLSCADIEKGARWSTDVGSRLQEAKVSIICLTPGNLHADWVLFEAGALSKTLDNTYVCPLLIGLEPADVEGPLAQFQATRATKLDVGALVKTINRALGDAGLQDGDLAEIFEILWPKLEERLVDLPADESAKETQRPERDLLEEILALVRNQARPQGSSLEEFIAHQLLDPSAIDRAVTKAAERTGVDYQNLRYSWVGPTARVGITVDGEDLHVRAKSEGELYAELVAAISVARRKAVLRDQKAEFLEDDADSKESSDPPA